MRQYILGEFMLETASLDFLDGLSFREALLNLLRIPYLIVLALWSIRCTMHSNYAILSCNLGVEVKCVMGFIKVEHLVLIRMSLSLPIF